MTDWLEAIEYTALVLLPIAIITVGYLVFKATADRSNK
jgi:hypothetical protein